ncbi:MAG TPA: DUF2065 domain-containing protein [Steroidobacteraceae bacterium]|nr:DUF2065 domain-containing protein [Steroidobacteraceae bacterium]
MNIAWPDFAAALGLLLVIEGLLPFLNPAGMRRVLATVSSQTDRALRIAGAGSMLAGLVVLWLFRS